MNFTDVISMVSTSMRNANKRYNKTNKSRASMFKSNF